MKYLTLPLLLLLSACGGNYKDASPDGTVTQFGAQKVTLIGGGLTVGANEIEGTGAVLFESRYPEFKTKGSYGLDFTLEDGGSLTLVSHGDNNLANGYEVKFERQGAGMGSLKVTLTAQGNSRDTVNDSHMDVFSGMDASGPLKIQIDVHNNESPAHCLAWSRLIADDFSEASSILNTEDTTDKSHGSPGSGAGVRWGLRLDNASVTRADLGAAKFAD